MVNVKILCYCYWQPSQPENKFSQRIIEPFKLTVECSEHSEIFSCEEKIQEKKISIWFSTKYIKCNLSGSIELDDLDFKQQQKKRKEIGNRAQLTLFLHVT